ncbi:uncharacterized protein C1683.06c-like [Schistocerca piceifrons]|uniref:uncharacterized protein C1683.06c-like n=1 Tax=Schistocerca piceifrons TaxID=274613 RepID=UPI001F5EFD5E|nr:uncharacterized protein C1683.06c-like [Schistocerca piceifrons]
MDSHCGPRETSDENVMCVTIYSRASGRLLLHHDQRKQNRWSLWLLLLGAALLLAALVSVLLLYPPSQQRPADAADRRQLQRGEAVRLLVDTDAGVDDAAALLLALATPGVSLEAVTCVHGNAAVRQVCRNVLTTLRAAHRLDVAVYAGAERPLGLPPPPTAPYFGADGFGDLQLDEDASPDPDRYVRGLNASDALVQMAAKEPGKLSLLCLGPLTNIALAVQEDPDFLYNLKHIVVLGGSVEGIGNVKPGVEFNFYMDPEAASFIFDTYNTSSAEKKPITLVPWETIFSRNHITMGWRKSVLGAVGGERVSLLNRAERAQLAAEASDEAPWLSGDPVAAAVLLRPALVTASGRYRLAVEVSGALARGAAFVDYSRELSPRNVRIVQRFDVDLYKRLLLQTLSPRPETLT